MKIVVVDANIIFNALITAGSKAASLLLQSHTRIRFVSCHFLQIELFKHKEKIQKLSGLDENSLLELLYGLVSQIEFVNEAYIPFECWQQAHRLLEEIDPNDTPYLALAIHLSAQLWTGDRRMSEGLAARGYSNCVTTSQLLEQ